MDISVDNEKDAAAIASAPYAGLGFLDTKEAEYTSTRQLNVQGQNIRRYTPDYGNNDYDGGDGGPSHSGGEYDPNNLNSSGGWSDYKDDVYSDGYETYGEDFGGGHSVGGPTQDEQSFTDNTPGHDFA